MGSEGKRNKEKDKGMKKRDGPRSWMDRFPEIIVLSSEWDGEMSGIYIKKSIGGVKRMAKNKKKGNGEQKIFDASLHGDIRGVMKNQWFA